MPQSLFPPASKDYVLSFQFSAWYPKFSKHTIKSTILRPLPADFKEYLEADGVFIPEGADNAPIETTLSDDEKDHGSDESKDDDPVPPKYHFPDLDKHIRGCIEEYGAVFPKLNFSSPKDASWLLPSSAPLKCTSPADVYMLLKSSDFINHDLLVDNVFEGCTMDEGTSQKTEYELELVLRKWYPVDRGREVRCFVRDNVLLGISQRDTNYYEFWNEQETKSKVIAAVEEHWEKNIRNIWTVHQDYTFDLLLTRDLSRGHILDFNPYMLKTDPLLFTYEELRDLFDEIAGQNHHPTLRTIESPSHPAATKSIPAYQHNMIPFDTICISHGRDIDEFADLWKESLKDSMSHAND